MHLLVNLQKWVDKHPNRLPVKEQMRWSINEAWMTSGLERKNSIKSVGIGRVTLVEYAIQTMRCSKSESFLTRSQAGRPTVRRGRCERHRNKSPPSSRQQCQRDGEREGEKGKTRLNVKSFTLSASASLSKERGRTVHHRFKLLLLTSYVAQLNA